MPDANINLVMESPTPMFCVDAAGKVQFANTASQLLFDLWEMQDGQTLPAEWARAVQDVLASDVMRHVDILCGDKVYVLSLVPLKADARVNVYSCDITERAAYEDQLKKNENRDSLTGLPTRILFEKLLDERIKEKNVTDVAIVVLGMARYAEHRQGVGAKKMELLSRSVSKTLVESIPDGAILGALGFSGIFAIAFTSPAHIANIEKIVKNILTEVGGLYPLREDEVMVEMHAGIVVERVKRFVFLTSFEQANMAFFHAKAEEIDLQFYVEKFDEKLKERQQCLTDLRKALSEHQFEMFYQPKYSPKTHEIVGAESLIRWHHPEKGMISPIDFIPLAEESGMILEMGKWMFEHVCAAGVAWQQAQGIAVPLAVNVAAAQFRDKGFVPFVKSVLKKTGLAPALLEVEVTEGMFISNIQEAISVMQALQAIGITVTIDDFGTGFSSLSYLKNFPINKIKIDKSFIDEMAAGDSCEVVSAIIHLGHSLGLKVVAEGIESELQLQLLAQDDCDEIQGYFYSRPLPAKDFVALFAK